VRNHLTDNWVIGGPSKPFSEEQNEQDKRLRMNLKEYRIKILGKKLKPYFVGPRFEYQYLVFDFNENEE
jgi:hypothetical protein